MFMLLLWTSLKVRRIENGRMTVASTFVKILQIYLPMGNGTYIKTLYLQCINYLARIVSDKILQTSSQYVISHWVLSVYFYFCVICIV